MRKDALLFFSLPPSISTVLLCECVCEWEREWESFPTHFISFCQEPKNLSDLSLSLSLSFTHNPSSTKFKRRYFKISSFPLPLSLSPPVFHLILYFPLRVLARARHSGFLKTLLLLLLSLEIVLSNVIGSNALRSKRNETTTELMIKNRERERLKSEFEPIKVFLSFFLHFF